MLSSIYRGFSTWIQPQSPVRLSRRLATVAFPSSSNPSPYQRKVMAVKDLVETAIADNKIAIFSKTWCPYCKRAKNLLATDYPDVETKIYELDELDEGADIQNYLYEKTGQRSVPSIFINQKHIGGCDDVVALKSAGKLGTLVSAL